MNNLKLNKYIKGFLLIALILFFMGIKPLSAYQEVEKIRVYRVQFAASKTFIQPSYFQTKFKLEEEVQYFVKDDWYKYYVGDFETEAEATSFYHETNDVGFVISSIIDKPIEIEEDTVQTLVPVDSLGSKLEDREGAGLISTDSLDRVFNMKLQQADSAFLASDFELAKSLFLETSSMKPDLEYSRVQLEKIEQMAEEGVNEVRNRSLGWLRILLILLIIFILIMLIRWSIRYMNSRQGTASEVEEEGISGDDKDREVEHWLSGKAPFSFLDRSDKDLSGWEQLRLYEKIRERKKAPPEFSFWLDSENASIVAFCLRMIRSFEQTGAYSAVVRLLDHKDDEIRAEAIVTLGELGNRQVLGLLRERFDMETYTNRMLILRAMARMPEKSSIDFLKELLKIPGDFRIEAAHALASIKSFGIKGVEKALKDMGEESETIARHILINKL